MVTFCQQYDKILRSLTFNFFNANVNVTPWDRGLDFTVLFSACLFKLANPCQVHSSLEMRLPRFTYIYYIGMTCSCYIESALEIATCIIHVLTQVCPMVTLCGTPYLVQGKLQAQVLSGVC
jgi:hypothetical protein